MRHPAVALVLVLLVAAGAYARDPSLLREPRFWAEEGTHYYGSALSRGVLDGLRNVGAAPHNSYLHTVPMVATVVAAHGLSLESAPHATTWAWALILGAVAIVAACGRAALLDPPGVRLVVALSPLLAVGWQENWANTLGAHFYCDLALVLLFLEAPRVRGARRAVSLFAFALFAILSPTCWIAAPAVVGMTLTRWRKHWSYAAVLLAVVAVHLWIHFALFAPAGREVGDPAALPHLFLSKFFIWPSMGQGAKYAYGNWAAGLTPDGFVWASVAVTMLISLLIGAFVLVATRDATTIVLFVTWLSSIGAYLFLGLGVERRQLIAAYNGGRYAFLPDMLLLALVAHQLATARFHRQRPRALAFGALLGAVLLVGVLEFFPSGFAAGRMRGFPWREEVAHFRADATYDQLRIAPPGWIVAVPSNPPR